jgi:hypothetical protein
LRGPAFGSEALLQFETIEVRRRYIETPRKLTPRMTKEDPP